ncbi:MAG: hypothetical protein ACW991_04560 [Candidatus Hodarchaeales archaeon]|jgi:hypothetical protein
MRLINQIGIGIQLILFLVGFVLFYDELWMFGIPLGRILPDLSPFHIEGFHHWMVGLSLMLVIIIHFIFSRIIQKTEQKQHVMDKQKRIIFTGSLFILFFVFLLIFSSINLKL